MKPEGTRREDSTPAGQGRKAHALAHRAVFLDRDGTILAERGYVTTPEDVVVLPGAASAIARLHKAGWRVIVVSNQGGVAKGLMTEAELEKVNRRMKSLLQKEGASIDGIYCCPHHPNGTVARYSVECACRKPRPGLLEQAAAEHGLDLSASVMVGDSIRDLQAGKAVGAAGVLVLTGHGTMKDGVDYKADHLAADLTGAVEWILSR